MASREQLLDALDELGLSFLPAFGIELDEVDRVAVRTEGQVVVDQLEQALAIKLVAPGGEAIERAVPFPLVATVFLQHGDQRGSEPVPADGNEMLGRRRRR